MKYLYYSLLITLLFSCGPNNTIEQDAPLVVSSTAITLNKDKPYAEITITEGAGNYSVTSSNEDVAHCILIDNKLYIAGYNIGNATITLTDQDKNQAKISVSIYELITRVSPETSIVFIKTGDTKSITNSDLNPLYYLMDTASVIQVGGTANSLQITAQKKGIANLYYLKEYWPTSIYNIQVIDHYVFVVSPTASTTLAVGGESEYYILSGCGNYTLTISNANVLSAELLAWPAEVTLSLNNPRVAHLKALASGSSTLKITNEETSEEKTFVVNVR